MSQPAQDRPREVALLFCHSGNPHLRTASLISGRLVVERSLVPDLPIFCPIISTHLFLAGVTNAVEVPSDPVSVGGFLPDERLALGAPHARPDWPELVFFRYGYGGSLAIGTLARVVYGADEDRVR